MAQISQDLVERAVQILASDLQSAENLDKSMLELAGDPILARRLTDWIPEAFGYVDVSQIKRVRLLREFLVRTTEKKWVWVPFDAEPIFAHAVSVAQSMIEGESAEKRRRIASKSSYLNSLQKALNDGNKVEGSTFTGPTFFGIPAEVYTWEKKSLWKRLWGG